MSATDANGVTKVAIVYYSGTGNIHKLAAAAAEAAEKAGAETRLRRIPEYVNESLAPEFAEWTQAWSENAETIDRHPVTSEVIHPRQQAQVQPAHPPSPGEGDGRQQRGEWNPDEEAQCELLERPLPLPAQRRLRQRRRSGLRPGSGIDPPAPAGPAGPWACTADRPA